MRQTLAAVAAVAVVIGIGGLVATLPVFGVLFGALYLTTAVLALKDAIIARD